MKFVLQEFDFVPGFQADSFPLVEFLPVPSSLDEDVVLVSTGQEDLCLSSLLRRDDVDSGMFPRYIGGVNLQQRSPS